MNFLLDQGLPRSTVQLLREMGIESDHVGELGMARASDEAILTTARQSEAVVVTLDADFHHLLAINGSTAPSVVRIRIEGLKSKELAELLERVLAVAGNELSSGAVVSVTESRIRVHLLPIGG